MSGYESPAKQKLRDALAKMGAHASPKLLARVEEAITKIDDTDPKVVAAKLPPTGEIPLNAIAADSERVQWAAIGAPDSMNAWFNNPRPIGVIGTSSPPPGDRGQGRSSAEMT